MLKGRTHKPGGRTEWGEVRICVSTLSRREAGCRWERGHPDLRTEALRNKVASSRVSVFCLVSCPKVPVAVVLNILMVWTCCLSLWVVFQVEPFASLSEAVQKSVPRLLINRDLVGSFAWSSRSKDVAQLGDVVQGVERLVDLLGWTQELQDLIQKETGKVQTLIFGPSPRVHILFWALTSMHCWHLGGWCYYRLAFCFLLHNSLLGHVSVTYVGGGGALRS